MTNKSHLISYKGEKYKIISNAPTIISKVGHITDENSVREIMSGAWAINYFEIYNMDGSRVPMEKEKKMKAIMRDTLIGKNEL